MSGEGESRCRGAEIRGGCVTAPEKLHSLVAPMTRAQESLSYFRVIDGAQGRMDHVKKTSSDYRHLGRALVHPV